MATTPNRVIAFNDYHGHNRESDGRHCITAHCNGNAVPIPIDNSNGVLNALGGRFRLDRRPLHPDYRPIDCLNAPMTYIPHEYPPRPPPGTPTPTTSPRRPQPVLSSPPNAPATERLHPSTAKLLTAKQLRPHWQLRVKRKRGRKTAKHIYDRTTRATGKSVAQASDLQVRPNGNTNNTVRYGGEHLLYDIRNGHLAVLMTTHEARRLATQNTASGNDLRCKAIHDT